MPKKYKSPAKADARERDHFLNTLPGFGPFRLDFNQGVLYKSGKEVKLRRMAFAVLRCLYEHIPKGPSHRQLEDYVWGFGAKVSDKNRIQTVNEAKKALGNYKHWIKNRPARGYFLDVSALLLHKTALQYQQVPNANVSLRGLVLSVTGRETIGKVAESLGVAESVLMQDVSKRMTEERLIKLLEDRANERMVRRKCINTYLLNDYYPESELLRHGFARYVIRVEDQDIQTNIAIPLQGLGIDDNLKAKSAKFKLVDSPLQMLSLKYEEVVDLVANSILLDVRADDDPVFCLQNIDLRHRESSASFSIAKYFEYRLTCGKLAKELTDALMETKFDVAEAYTRREKLLPLRKDLMKDASDLARFGDRVCVGGVNVFFALRRPKPYDDFAFYVEERSDAVESAPREVCIIPTGFHQPLTRVDAACQVSIRESVFRELWEELFNGKKVISHDGHTEPDWYYDYPPLQWFEKNKKNFVLEWMCFGLDLTNGTYQFGVFLVVKDAKYWKDYRRRISTNYEFRHTGAKLVPISTKKPEDIAAILQNPLLAHTSVFTLAEGLQRLKKLDCQKKRNRQKGHVDLPNIERVRVPIDGA